MPLTQLLLLSLLTAPKQTTRRKTTPPKHRGIIGGGGGVPILLLLLLVMTSLIMFLSSGSKRAGLVAVRAWTLRPTTTTISTSTSSRYRRGLSSLAAAASARKNQFGSPSSSSDRNNDAAASAYSVEDWRAAMAQRELPPSMFQYEDDDDDDEHHQGYGAHNYQPEMYDDDDDWMNGPPSSDNYNNNDPSLYPDDVVSNDPVVPEELLAPVSDDDEDGDDMAGSAATSQPPMTTASNAASSALSFENQSTQSDVKITKEEKASSIPSPFKGLEAVLAQAPPAPPPPPLEPPQPTKRRASAPSTPSYTHVARANLDDQVDKNTFLTHSAARGTFSDSLDDLRDRQLPDLQRQIYQQNDNQEFNINSPQQVSLVLFGVKGKSTNKDTLEGMAAAGSRMADLILHYRRVAASIKRLERRATQTAEGTHVTSVSTVARTANKENIAITTTAATAVETVAETADPLLLLDASSFIFRAYHVMPPIHRADGMPTGAVLGFCNMLNRLVIQRLLDGEQPRMILAFDSPGPSFRKGIYDKYKANRPEAPMDLIPQFALIRQASAAFGVPIVEAQMFEADDVIATLARQAHLQGLDVNILSGDKDLMQLVTGPAVEPCIHMIDPMSMSRITYKQVVEKWGVGPEKLGDVLALAGDAVDNVPGVPGIGPKTACTLLDEYGNLENLLANAEKIKQKIRREKLMEHADTARMSRDLVELREDVDSVLSISGNLTEWRTEPLDTDRLFSFYDEMGFRDLKRRLQNSLQRGTPRKRPKSRSGKEKVEVPNPEDFADVPF